MRCRQSLCPLRSHLGSGVTRIRRRLSRNRLSLNCQHGDIIKLRNIPYKQRDISFYNLKQPLRTGFPTSHRPPLCAYIFSSCPNSQHLELLRKRGCIRKPVTQHTLPWADSVRSRYNTAYIFPVATLPLSPLLGGNRPDSGMKHSKQSLCIDSHRHR